MTPRWDPCVVQDGADFKQFITSHIDQPRRKILLIGGAGFDPRATKGAHELATIRRCQVDAVFFREERVMDQPILRPRADNTQIELSKLLPNAIFPKIEIIPDGVTAVGGRRAVEEIKQRDFSQYTDVAVDISALSCGVYFSLIAFLINICRQKHGLNLHLFVVEQPQIDQKISGIPSDQASMLHGFRGTKSLDSTEEQALLWIPILSLGNSDVLTKIYQYIRSKSRSTPIDVCPILPFPCRNPRLPDLLYTEYFENLRTWGVDDRDFLYAAESDPLDSYRTIHNLVSERHKLFAALGGSQVVLSPLGNKMLSVGAMLAAIDLDLPVVLVESIGYDEQIDAGTSSYDLELRHVWLCGEAYPSISIK
ncbi:hypothetical protein [Ereboglobus luteus]|uniref:hypothetical protein n=1 Tax=Ereboglobus luteus TaxID=1796921 RepID=UPI0012600E20|nr:hypothetical protein [Ereboglobus luteus]